MRLISLLLCCVALRAASAQSAPAWHLVHEATFSGADDPAAELDDIRGIEISKNGNVLVLDHKAQSIRVFAPDGHFLMVLSRNGQGPGEFEAPDGFARAPDGNIWVDDADNRRYTVLRDDGSYVKDVPSTLNSWGYLWDGYFDAAGRLVNTILIANPGLAAAHGLATSTRFPVLERRSIGSNQADTVDKPACYPSGLTRHDWSAQSAHGGIMMSVPFEPSESMAHSPDDFAWCAFGAEYTIYKLKLGRIDTMQVIHRSATAAPVTGAERDSAVASAKAFFIGAHQDPSVIVALDVPRTKPIITSLLLDDQGRLWVRLTPAINGHTRYDVYGATGVEVGTIDFPSAISQGPDVVIRGDKLYGVVLDQDDVPSVQRFRIEKR